MINELDLVNNFVKVFKTKPSFYIDAGGRYEICGNHTDHNHGLCLVANASLRICAVANKNSKMVNIQSKGFPFITFNLDDLSSNPKEYSTTLSLCKGILYKMKLDGYQIGGFDLYMDSEIPDGSGVSSSAAVESLFGYLVSYLYNDGKIPPMVIAKNGQFSENNYFHKPCGLLDQIGTSFDSSNFIDFKDINNPVVTTLPFNLPLTLYLIKSAGTHSGLTALYAAIPNAMYAVANKLDNKKYLRDVSNVLDVYDKIDKLDFDDHTKRIAKHFYLENNNVRVARRAIEENNIEDFLGAIRASQYSSLHNLENTYVKGEFKNSPQDIIDHVSAFLGKFGAVRIHGGGFKGTVICFVKNDFTKDFEAYLEKNYKDRHYKVNISNKAVNFKKLA